MSTVQRVSALAIANDHRFAMSGLKAKLRSMPREQALQEAARIVMAPPPYVEHMQLHVFLGAIPRVGDERTRRICVGARVWPLRRLEQLTPGERQRVADLILQNGGW